MAKIYTGKEFNELTKGKTFWKLDHDCDYENDCECKNWIK